MNRFLKAYLLLIIGLAVLTAGIFIGRYTTPGSTEKNGQQVLVNKEASQPEEVDFHLFWDVWNLIEQKYADRENLDYQEMIYGAISGLVNSLGDPYSLFMSPQESKEFLEDMQGKFEGIGAEIGIRNGVLTIIAPLKNTPADRAGLRAGDKVLKVDETLTADLSLQEAVRLIRGPKGTEVKLTILREEEKESREIGIIRDVIEVPSVEWEMKEGDIAHIELYSFTEAANSELSKVGNEILSSNAKGIILDLRNNPGGYLEIAIKVAGQFLQGEKVIAIEDFGNGQKKEYKSSGSAKLKDFPLVVLINQGSASASEIVAGALRDHRGVKLVGQQSFGKGSIQEMEELKSGSSLKITIAKWLTPSGVSITDKGLEPDIKVEMTAEDYDQGRDPQLEEAIKILR